jgi:hypothetical protein
LHYDLSLIADSEVQRIQIETDLTDETHDSDKSEADCDNGCTLKLSLQFHRNCLGLAAARQGLDGVQTKSSRTTSVLVVGELTDSDVGPRLDTPARTLDSQLVVRQSGSLGAVKLYTF